MRTWAVSPPTTRYGADASAPGRPGVKPGGIHSAQAVAGQELPGPGPGFLWWFTPGLVHPLLSALVAVSVLPIPGAATRSGNGPQTDRTRTAQNHGRPPTESPANAASQSPWRQANQRDRRQVGTPCDDGPDVTEYRRAFYAHQEREPRPVATGS